MGLGPRRTRYAGASFCLFDGPRKRFKKSSASPPPAVDPVALASAQTASNQATANTQANLNNVNTFNPTGSSSFSQMPNGQFNLSENLSPPVQDLYNQALSFAQGLGGEAAGIAGAAPNLAGIGQGFYQNAGNIPTPQGVDFSGQPPLPTSASDIGSQRTQAQNAAYNTQTGYLDPQFAQKRSDLSQQLADQGIQVGSDAYSRAQGDLGRESDLAYQQAQNAAVAAGNQEQQQLYGEQLSSRQQGVQEQQQQFQDPFTAIGALTSAGNSAFGTGLTALDATTPFTDYRGISQVPVTVGNTVVSPSNVVGAGQVAAQNAANRFQAGNTLNNQLFNGLGSLGGVANTALGGGASGGLLGSLGSSLFSGLGSSGLAGATLGSFSAAAPVAVDAPSAGIAALFGL